MNHTQLPYAMTLPGKIPEIVDRVVCILSAGVAECSGRKPIPKIVSRSGKSSQKLKEVHSTVLLFIKFGILITEEL
eukprot:459233-Amphidinium_carterae.1